MSKEHIRPVPMVMLDGYPKVKYVAAVCPACGKYPGNESWQVCQYCDRWVEAYSSIVDSRSFWQKLFG